MYIESENKQLSVHVLGHKFTKPAITTMKFPLVTTSLSRPFQCPSLQLLCTSQLGHVIFDVIFGSRNGPNT